VNETPNDIQSSNRVDWYIREYPARGTGCAQIPEEQKIDRQL
jgi:hypothetical protein